jgi:hypothetical protein
MTLTGQKDVPDLVKKMYGGQTKNSLWRITVLRVLTRVQNISRSDPVCHNKADFLSPTALLTLQLMPPGTILDSAGLRLPGEDEGKCSHLYMEASTSQDFHFASR